MNQLRREANKATSDRRKRDSVSNKITLGMRRKVIQLRFGAVGNTVKIPIKRNQKDCFNATRIACTVGLKVGKVSKIIAEYIKNDFEIKMPQVPKGGPPCPITQEAKDFFLDRDTVTRWTPLTMHQRRAQLKMSFDTEQVQLNPSL